MASVDEKTLQIMKYFETFDTNGSGYLDFQQFSRFVKKLNPGMAESDIQQAFCAADTNKNNMISAEEFVAWTLNIPVSSVQNAAQAIRVEETAKQAKAEDAVGLALGTLYSGFVVMWNLNTGKQQKTLGCLPELKRYQLEHNSTKEERDKATHLGKINCIVVDWEGKRFLTGSADHTIKLWRLSGSIEKTFHGCISEILCLDVDWKRGMFVSGGLASQVKIWSLKEPRPLETFQNERKGEFAMSCGTTCIAASWDKNLVVCGADNWLQLWDLTSKTQFEGESIQKPQCMKKLEGHEGPISGVLADFETMRAVSASKDKTLRLWDLTAGTVLQVFAGHEGEVLCVTGDLSMGVVVSGGSKGDIKFWDIGTAECKRTLSRASAEVSEELQGHKDAVLSLAIGPLFRFVVSGSCDGTVKMWDSETKKCIRTIDADEDRWGGIWVTDIAVQPKVARLGVC